MFYLLHGEDEFSRSEALAGLKERMGDPAMAELNTILFDGRKVTLDELKHACDAVPFLADRRLVIVEGLLSHLTAGRKKKGQAETKDEPPAWKKAYLEGLVDYLKRLPDTTRLILVEHKSIDARHPIRKLAEAEAREKRAYVQEFRPLQRGQVQGWIRKQAQSKGAEIAPAAAEELVAFVGGNLRLLDQEIDKLIAYVDRTQTITEKEVRLLVSYVQEANVFEMVDALGRRDGQLALTLLHRLLEDGNPPLALLGMIVRQFRIMIQVKELEQRGVSRSEIGARLNLHPFVVEKGGRQARNFSMQQLEQIYDKLVKTDWDIKTGRLDPILALDTLVIGLSGRNE